MTSVASGSELGFRGGDAIDDDRLPGLATLLDPDALLETLRAAFPEADLRHARPVFVRYKPAKSCAALYELDAGRERVMAYGRAWPAGELRRRAKALATTAAPGALGPGAAVLHHEELLILVYPNDRRLPALVELADPARRRHALGRLAPDWSSGASDFTPLRWRPERRFVGKITAPATSDAVAVKAVAAMAYESAVRTSRAIRSTGPLRVPALVGCSDNLRAFSLEWLPGTPLHEALRGGSVESRLLARVGAALAELHGQRHALSVEGPAHVSAALQGRAQHLASVRGVSLRISGLASVVGERLRAGTGRALVTSHGDFTATQVLVNGPDVAVLDLDDAALSERERDLGLFLAYLERLDLTGELSADEAAALTGAFLEGYAEHAGARPDASRLRTYQAAALIARSGGPLRHGRSNWLETLDRVLDRAEALLRADA